MEKYNAETLKPCPHCKGEAEIRGYDAPEFWIRCKNECQPMGNDLASVIRRWNTRPPTEPVVPLSEVLELLEAEAENSRVKGGMYVGIACSILIGAIKQKYGVSE